MMQTILQYSFRFFLLAFILIPIACSQLKMIETNNRDNNYVEFKRTYRDIFPADQTRLIGRLTKPTGDGPFPAVVLLLDNDLRNKGDYEWEKKLTDMGYVTLLVDSLGSRGIDLYFLPPERGDMHINWELMSSRANDAFDAKNYLAGLPFVNPQKIAVIGWLLGGSSLDYGILNNKIDSFQAVVSIYGGCRGGLSGFNAPYMNLAIEGPSNVFGNYCRKQIVAPEKNNYEVLLKVYPLAYGGFDFIGSRDLRYYYGYLEHHYMYMTLKYDQTVAEDATIQVKNFLAKYLK